MDPQTHDAETFAERRKNPRYPFKLKVTYQMSDKTGTRSFLSQSITRDLGIGGVALMVEEKLETGQVLNVNIGLPKAAEAVAFALDGRSLPIDKTVTLNSRVIWRQPYDSRRFIVGVQFLDLMQEDAQSLKAFLQEFRMHDGKVEAEE